MRCWIMAALVDRCSTFVAKLSALLRRGFWEAFARYSSGAEQLPTGLNPLTLNENATLERLQPGSFAVVASWASIML